MKQFWDEILAANETSDACLATVVATEGTAPRKEGSKMLIIGGKSLKVSIIVSFNRYYNALRRINDCEAALALPAFPI